MRSAILFLALALMAFLPLRYTDAASQGQLPAAGVVSPQTAIQTRPEAPTEDQKVALLRAELNATREFNDAILSTVYWALGGTFVLVGLLLGFGWFANFRVYERDKAAMKSELDAAITAKASEIEFQVSEKLLNLPEQIGIAVTDATERKLKELQQTINSMSSKLLSAEVRRLKKEMHANPSDSMALTDALNLIRLCVKSRPDELPEIMKFMLQKIDTGGKLTATEITRLNEVLDSLPPHYRTLTEKLRTKLVASDIF